MRSTPLTSHAQEQSFGVNPANPAFNSSYSHLRKPAKSLFGRKMSV
jgi:hypothetical protein